LSQCNGAHQVNPILSCKLPYGFVEPVFQQNTDAKSENECKIYDDEQVFDSSRAFDLGLVQAEPCGFQLLEKGFNFESFAIVVTGHFA